MPVQTAFQQNHGTSMLSQFAGRWPRSLDRIVEQSASGRFSNLGGFLVRFCSHSRWTEFRVNRTFAAVIRDADAPCSAKTATTRPLNAFKCSANSKCVKWHQSERYWCYVVLKFASNVCFVTNFRFAPSLQIIDITFGIGTSRAKMITY